MKRKRKLLSLASALAVGLTLLPALPARALEPAVSQNLHSQSYTTWGSTVDSYLYDNGAGFTRVEPHGPVTVEEYSYDFRLLNSLSLERELPFWGGFYAGETYNFLFFGQSNTEEDDNKEVFRVVRYDKDWHRLDSAGLFGANTTEPFDAGSLRCDEYNGYLYVRTAHEMYTSSDGLNHQANVTFCVREQDMQITDAFYEVMNASYGYVSHSFNQFILVDEEGTLVAADHGDAYPRSFVVMQYPTKAGGDSFVPDGFAARTTTVDLLEFPGSIGQNATGASLGGLAETSQGYVAAYNWCSDGSFGGNGQRDVYLSFVPKNNFSQEGVTTVKLTAAPGSSTPVLAPAGLTGGYVLWEEMEDYSYTGNVCYVPYNAGGTVGQATKTSGKLSDCQPIPYGDGGVAWYVTDQDGLTFYTLDADGLKAHPVEGDKPLPDSGTAYPRTVSVAVDGSGVEFQMYALRDEKGNETNFIKLRDLAYVLNGTQAQFNIVWDGETRLESGVPYQSNGSEMTTPFSGERTYQAAADAVRLDGAACSLQAFYLKDDAGSGYTYYKLRDLGQALDFNVGWDNGSIYVETGRPYDPAN